MTADHRVLDELRELAARYHARMAELQRIFSHDDRLIATRIGNRSYKILLTRDMSGETQWRVTSFLNGEPIGHRCYDHLDDGGPTQNALHEFIGEWEIQR